MAEIKNPEAYFGTMVRNMDKNDFRANDNYYKHFDSVGDETDIRRKMGDEKGTDRQDDCSIESSLCEASMENWLSLLENEKLHSALLKLTATNKRLVYMLYVQNLKQSECAEILDITQGAVAQRHSHIKKYLKVCLST